MEIWKDIIGYGGIYKISNHGKVRSIDRIVVRKSSNMLVRGKLINQHPNSKGYMRVQLSKESELKKFFVHRLVAFHFIENDKAKPHINHIDGNPTNNHVDNLEWVTHSENLKHFWDNFSTEKHRLDSSIRLKKYMATKPPSYKAIKVQQYDLEGNFIKEYSSALEAQRETGIHNSSIKRCCYGENKTSGGFIWKEVRTKQKKYTYIKRVKKYEV